MSEADIIEAMRTALNASLMIAAPPLIAATVLGLAIALLQALTQVQEMTLTFVPKFVVVITVSSLGAPAFFLALKHLSEFVFDRISGGQVVL